MRPRDSNAEQRFIAGVVFPDEPDGCWEWQGALKHGYGRIRADGKQSLVHRYAYELIIGQIPPSYDEGTLDILPYLTLSEQAYAVELVGIPEAYQRLTNKRLAA